MPVSPTAQSDAKSQCKFLAQTLKCSDSMPDSQLCLITQVLPWFVANKPASKMPMFEQLIGELRGGALGPISKVGIQGGHSFSLTGVVTFERKKRR